MPKKNKWSVVVGSVLVFGLVTGCGAGVNSNKTQGSEIENSQQDKVHASFHSSIETKEEGNTVLVSYKIMNISGSTQKLTFSSGLKADYILYDKTGKKVRQHSEEVMSSQAMEEVALQNDEEIIQEFQIDNLEKGEYVLEVFLTANEENAKVMTDILITESLATNANGVLVGLIDPHSVEIKIDGKGTAFQLSDKAIEQIDSIEDGISVSFSFTESLDDVKTIQSFTQGTNSEKIELTKSVLELDKKLVSIHTSFIDTRDINVLKGLKPFEIFQLYMYTKAGEDYETLYHFHNKEDAIVDVVQFKKENMTSEASNQKNQFMINLDQVREFEVVETGENRVFVAFKMPHETDKVEFKMEKGNNGVWYVMWVPFQ